MRSEHLKHGKVGERIYDDADKENNWIDMGKTIAEVIKWSLLVVYFVIFLETFTNTEAGDVNAGE